jgi:ABC transporter with metal-binding/Fe-S-binding domain ATP-binding protein
MKLAALFSGGKDSVYALYLAQLEGHQVTHLVTICPKNTSSWMFHSVNIGLTKYSAQALDIPLIQVVSEGEKEMELLDLSHALASLPVDGIVSGAVASEYQRSRIDRICQELGLHSSTPLWHRDPEQLLRDHVQAGFQTLIVGVFAEGLGKNWLGRQLTSEVIDELVTLHKTKGIHIAGEGGEYETLVINGPNFSKRLQIQQATPTWNRDSGIYHIEHCSLQE